MASKKIAVGSVFMQTKPLSDWLACVHLFNTDPGNPKRTSIKFAKQNLRKLANTMAIQLKFLDLELPFYIKNLTTVQDYRYNIFLNVADNVCLTACDVGLQCVYISLDFASR